MTKLKLIKGARRELEYLLLAALFTPGGDVSAEALKQRLASRDKGQLRAVGTAPSPGEPPPLPGPVDDQT